MDSEAQEFKMEDKNVNAILEAIDESIDSSIYLSPEQLGKLMNELIKPSVLLHIIIYLTLLSNLSLIGFISYLILK